MSLYNSGGSGLDEAQVQALIDASASPGIDTIATGIAADVNQDQGNATPLVSVVSIIATCATADDAVLAPAATAGAEFEVLNNGAAVLAVFPASGDNFTRLSANAATYVNVNQRKRWRCNVEGTWVTISPEVIGQSSDVTLTDFPEIRISPPMLAIDTIRMSGSYSNYATGASSVNLAINQDKTAANYQGGNEYHTRSTTTVAGSADNTQPSVAAVIASKDSHWEGTVGLSVDGSLACMFTETKNVDDAASSVRATERRHITKAGADLSAGITHLQVIGQLASAMLKSRQVIEIIRGAAA